MNYAKVLDAALQLFPRKIRVTCIDGITGNQIGTYKIGLSQLPPSFNKPVSLTIDGREWRVIKAHPAGADDISIFRKLTLHVLGKDQLQQVSLGHNVPTRHAASAHPTTTPFFQQFTLDITADEWLQLEFLPISAMPEIQEEMALIDPILLAEGDRNPLMGYGSIHIRQLTAQLGADIPFDAFCAAIPISKKGNVRLDGNDYVENGFALQSDNYTYYGTLVNNRITHLSLLAIDGIDDEFAQVATTWNLLLVDWCKASITMAGSD
ncbi:hypothetical protein [Longitalea luteola]|uniref:hypothetical protein n=1 Tax=Longitalea luteola TaxID=2812563 RepID=UPI001A9773BA|nr:hypothetical protein [Longitalea luteola]